VGRPASPADERRPLSVTLGIAALTLALGLGVAILAWGWDTPLVALVTLALVGSLIVGTARGHNWARWALTLLTAAALVLMFPVVRFQLTYGVLLPLATATQLALELVGCYLLFRAPGGAWYRRGRGAAA
jgi:hypothetical protein